MSDRHKTRRTFLNGSEKRKAANEKQKKENEVISRTRSMSEFLTSKSTSADSNPEIAVDSCTEPVLTKDLQDFRINTTLEKSKVDEIKDNVSNSIFEISYEKFFNKNDILSGQN